MVDFLTSLNVPFRVTGTNYTTRIVSRQFDTLFMKQARSNRTFIAFMMLKRDVEGKKVEDIDPETVRYYDSKFNIGSVYADKVYNIDLKSAYASILLMDGIISKKTYNFLMKLDKVERLAAVGMLAGRKFTFTYSGGKIVDTEETISTNSNFFFHAVQRTFEIMQECKNIIGNTFIFSWVDGIYYGDPSKTQAVVDFLHSKGLKCSQCHLDQFEIEQRETCYKLSYTKEEERKWFFMPLEVSGLRKQLYALLTNKNQQRNEKFSVKNSRK